MTWCSLCDEPAVLCVVTPTLDPGPPDRAPVCGIHLVDACLAVTTVRGYVTVRPLGDG